MKRTARWILFFLFSNILLFGVALAQQGSEPNAPVALFTPGQSRFASEPLPAMIQRADVRQTRRVDVNLSALSADPERIALELFDGRQVIAVHERTEAHGLIPGGTVWVGRIEDDPFSIVALTLGAGQMVGEISPFGEKYQLLSTGSGHVLVESEAGISLPPDGSDDSIPVSAPESYRPDLDMVQTVASRMTPVQIDQVMLYTTNARIAAGGTTQMLNLIELAEVVANQYFINSDLDVRLNIVHAAETVYTALDSTTDLARLVAYGDGYMDEIHTLRNTYNGDLGGVIVDTGEFCGGRAQLMGEPGLYFESYAFNWMALPCANGGTLAHEVGHNLGSNHNREEYTAFTSGSFPYSYGYRVLGGYATVMAYDTDCTVSLPCTYIPYFSQPNRIVNGQAMGTANANNALSISQTAATVANFRPLPTLPTDTNLLVATDFARFDFPWYSANATLSTTAGVLNATTTAANGYIGQIVAGRQIAAGTKFNFNIDIANPTATARTVNLYLLDNDNATNSASYYQFCTFTINANAPLQKYALRASLPVAWTGIQVYVQIPASGANLRFASPDFRIRPSQAAGLSCPGNGAPSTIAPTVTPGATATSFLETLTPNVNLVTEPDFAPLQGIWTTSNLTTSVSGGVLTAQTTAANASFSQRISFLNIAAGSKFTVTMDIGNNDSSARTVTVFGFAQEGSQYCQFAIPANSPLQTYTLQFIVPAVWSNINFYTQILQSGANLRFAEPNFMYTPDASFSTLQCLYPTIASTSTPTATATRTPTMTPTATRTPTPSATASGATVNATIGFQGRPAAPNALLVVALSVKVAPSAGGAAVFDGTLTTDNNGRIVLNLAPGSYNIRVKGSHTLSTMTAITVISGVNNVALGTLKEGDANDDNVVTINDFSLLASSFGKLLGQAGYDGRTDFNGDSAVTINDFSLLASNFGQSGQN